MITDRERLTQYARDASEEAFAEIVRRHTDMVYSSCLRVLGDAHAAEDAAQATFLLLAQRAGKLSRRTTVSGWLFRTAQYVALHMRRKRARQARHEREAAMRARTETKDALWEEMRPALDAALVSLPQTQRDVVVLRHLCGRSETEVARELGCPKSTVSTRLSRALVKLRGKLRHSGVVVPTALLATLIGERAVAAAPAGLAASIQAACSGKAAASGAALSITKGVLKMMMWAKIKMIAGVVLAVGIVAGTGTRIITGQARDAEARALSDVKLADDELQGPGEWPPPSSVSEMRFKGRPAKRVDIEVRFSVKVFFERHNIDVTEGQAVLSRSKPVDIGSMAHGGKPFASSCRSNKAWGHVESLNKREGIWVPNWKEDDRQGRVHFGINLPGTVLVNKIGIHQRPFGGGFKGIRLAFSEGEPVTIELPSDAEEGKPTWEWKSKMRYFMFPARRTNLVKAEVLSYHNPRGSRDGNGPGIHRFEIYPAKDPDKISQPDSGHVATSDISPYRLGSWLRFEPDHDPKGGGVVWEYSLDSGDTWEKMPRNGDLSSVSMLKKKIRFRAKLQGPVGRSPVVKSFRLSWVYLPTRPIATPLDPKTCRLKVRNGTFADQTGKRVSLCGIWDGPGYLGMHNRRPGDPKSMEKAARVRAHWGMNVIRLGINGTFILPDAKETFPDSPRYAEVMKKLKFNPEYVKELDTLIGLLAKYGIYTFLEFHDNPPFGHWSQMNKGKEEGLPENKHYARAVQICVEEGRIYEMWSWMARHYRDNPYVLGFEIPWNEPLLGGEPKDLEKLKEVDDRYYKVCERCAKAIKKEAPDKLVLLGPNIWNGPQCFAHRPKSSTWDFPKEVDAIHFHSYPRGGEGQMRRWYMNIFGMTALTASHKPLVVSEGHPMYIFRDKVDLEKGNMRRGTDCILGLWYASGLQTVAWWGHRPAWSLSDMGSRFHTWTNFWKKHPPKTLDESEVAIVCRSVLRHPHAKGNWFPIVFRLKELHVAPFAALFDDCVLKYPQWLKRYKAVIVYDKDLSVLSEEIADTVRRSGVPYLELSEEAVSKGGDMGVKDFLSRNGVFVNTRNPSNVLVAYGEDAFVVHEGSGKGGVYKIYPHLEARGKVRVRDYDTEKIVARSTAKKIYRDGIIVRVGAYRTKLYEVLKD